MSNKYGAVRHEEDGYTFASGAELRRYRELRLLRDQGVIGSLDVHPMYRIEVNGVKITRYTADFRYVEDGVEVVEDVKGGSRGSFSEAYRLRKKLMKAVHGIDVVEVAA